MRYLVFSLFFIATFYCEAQKNTTATATNTIVINSEKETVKFQTSQEKLETKPLHELTYYWCKSNKLHTTKGGYDGALLNGEYTAYYLSKQLKEKGMFDKGLKTGIWKTWYESGEISETSSFKKGVLHGEYKKYDEQGNTALEANYKNGVLNGETKSYANGKLLKTTLYKNGEEVILEEKAEKDSTKNKMPSLFKPKEENTEVKPNR